MTPWVDKLVARWQAERGVAPAAEPAGLQPLCDALLGGPGEVVAILDAVAAPERQIPTPEVWAAARAGAPLKVAAARWTFVEVRREPLPDDVKRMVALAGDNSRAFIVDPVAKRIWSSDSHEDDWLRRALDAPDRPLDVEPARPRVIPVATLAILGVLVVGFVLEILLPAAPTTGFLTPAVPTLVSLGGLMRGLVHEGDWYRLFTCALLHGDPLHIFMNGIALLIAGAALEPLVGRAWFVALFGVSTAGGALLSMVVNPTNLVSVGASGAIMGLFAAGMICAARLPQAQRSMVRRSMAQVLVPSLLPIATTFGKGTIDYGAHFGGAITGAAFGLLLLAMWPSGTLHPRFPRVSQALAAATILAFGASSVEAGRERAYDLAVTALIPDAELPKTDDQIRSQAASLAERYPHDPRGHYFAALVARDAGDRATAEKELRAALADKELLDRAFKPALRSAIEKQLGEIDQDKR